jgi:hypothetical protein
MKTRVAASAAVAPPELVATFGYEPPFGQLQKRLGDRMEITIRIPPEIRVFTPFFTARPAGERTGLALSISHDIVKQNVRSIEVETEPGKFTEFKIYSSAGRGIADEIRGLL